MSKKDKETTKPTATLIGPTTDLLSETILIKRPKPRVVKIPTVSFQALPSIKETDAIATDAIVKAVEKEALNISESLKKKSSRSIALAERTFAKFERIVGGRERLFEVLQLSPPDRPYAHLLGKFLADAEIATAPLHKLAMKYKMPVSVLVVAYRDAKALLVHLEAVEHLAAKMPAVTEQIAEDAQNKYRKCDRCEGSGRSYVIEGGEFVKDEFGQKLTVVCFDCRGVGKLYSPHSFQNRKLMVEMVGATEQKPLVQQTFNTNNNTLNANFTPGDSSFEGLMRAADKIVHTHHVQQIVDNESSNRDRTITPNQTEGTLDSGDRGVDVPVDPVS